MPILTANHIYKSYVVDPILEDISFHVEYGDKIGVLGLNGTGKTTLFQVLSGRLHMDQGQVQLQKGLKIGYLEQHTKIESQLNIFDECLLVFENLIQMEQWLRKVEIEISQSNQEDQNKLEKLMDEYGHALEEFTTLNGYGYKSEIRGVLKGLGFGEDDFEKPVEILSGGQKSRLSLAKLLLEKPDLLLLDEPTNHLDIAAISWLEKFLKDYKGSSLIISHDRYFLDHVANRIFYMENRSLQSYNTDYTGFMVQRKKELEIMKRQYDNQQKEVKRQEEIIQRFMNYGGERYTRQARSRQKMLDKIKLVPKLDETKKATFRFDPETRSGRDVLHAEGICKRFDDLNLLEDISLDIYREEKVGLIGPNGVGKTTLFRILLGQVESDRGTVKLGQHVYPGYFDQEMSDLNLHKTVLDEIWDSYPLLDHYQIRTYLSQFLFVGDDIFKEIHELSGGEKARVALLKLMLSKSNFLLMDEPTNHLDIDSKEVLEDALRNYSGTIFVISHDRYFLNQVATKILELTEDGITEYIGNYDYYLEKKAILSIPDEEDEDQKTKTQIKLEKKKEKEILKKEKESRKLIKNLETTISNLEDKIKEVDRKLSDPDIYNDHQNVLKLSNERESLQNQLDEIYAQWMEFEE
ncbi:ABC-F family ATP-binding cassette domain-containing protein [Gudongella sp. DL1XJH-153]|uniref:ABC-F family ATP-binding cassette domain-containing protein n=1 Tax=Gudongella sp. DL1XJH-153 TaxID=3409804 RepID=UPI003BB64785